MNTRAQDFSPDPPEGSLAAAEYVLGVLDAVSLRHAQMRLEREPAFAYDVAAWQKRLAPLIDEIIAVPVPFALWPRIQAAVGFAPSAIEHATGKSETAAPSVWRSLGLWRWLSAGSLAAAAASLAALFLVSHPNLPAPLAPTHELVATMLQDDGKPLFAATIDPNSGKLVLLPLAVSIPADRVAELWLIPPGDKPHSLGLLDPTHAAPVIVPATLRAALAAKSIVAVSLEPPGGAPGGQPTGPIIAKGEIALL